jgi:hypothetical protein
LHGERQAAADTSKLRASLATQTAGQRRKPGLFAQAGLGGSPPPPERSPQRQAARPLPGQGSGGGIHEQVARPQAAFNLALGFGVGGDRIASAQLSDGSERNLDAGTAGFAGVGAMITPLWLADRTIGFGLGVDAGWRGATIEAANGSLSLTRFPVVAMTHVLVGSADSRWYLHGGIGVHKEFAVTLSGSGIAEGIAGDLESSLGLLGEGGPYCHIHEHLAFGVALRYTVLKYSTPAGGSINGDHLGVIIRLGIVL